MAFKINLGILSVTIGADADTFKKEMKEVKAKLKENAKALRSNVNTWGKWGLAVTAAGATALAAFTKSNLSAIRELKILASTANTSTKEFQRGAFAAEQFGIETEKYGDILKDVNDRVGDFITTGAGPMIDFFEQIGPKIGVTIENFKGLSGQQALGLYIQSLQKANLSQEEMTFFMEAIASDSTRLIPLFRDNAKVFNALTKEAEELGVGLSDLDVATVELANRELSKTAAFFTSIGQELTVQLAPVITGISMALNDAAKDAGGFGKAIEEAIDFGVDAIGVFADGIHGVGIIFKGLEVIARSVFLEISKGVDLLTFGSIQEIGRSIADFVIAPLKGTLEILAIFSDTAKSALGGLNKFMDDFAGKNKESLGEFAQAQADAFAVAQTELQDLLTEKLPSSKIAEFVKDAQQKFRDEISKQDAIDLTGGGLVAPPGAPSPMDQGEKSEADRLREENLSILEALIEGANMREETLLGRLAREKEITDTALRNKEISQAEHSRIMNDIEQREADTKLSIISNSADAAIQALSIGGKKTEKLQRRLAIANALIKGKQAAVDAWQAGMSTGGPFAPIVAAAYTAASIARTTSMINSIRSSGSSGGGGGGGGGLPSAAGGANAGGVASGSASAQQTAPRVDIRFIGQGPVPMDQIREQSERMREAFSDGVPQFNVVGGG